MRNDLPVRIFLNLKYSLVPFTVMPTKSDSDIIFCLQLLSQILTCTSHLIALTRIDRSLVY